jgi:simple sugar transport system permease protein
MVAIAPSQARRNRRWLGRLPRNAISDSLVALIFALACGAIVLLLTGHDPVDAYREWLQRGLLRSSGLQQTLVRATPLLITSLAVLLAMRAGVWNIGIDGQVLVGALAAAIVASQLDGLPRSAMWIGAATAGLLAGAAWIVIPAVLRGKFGINEIVTTLMFNYVALSLTSWLVKGPAGDSSVVSPQTKLVPREMRFPNLGDTRVHLGLIVALILLVLAGVFFARTVAGFELAVVGQSARAAFHANIPVAIYVTAALVVSGGIAALAGANDVLSTKGTFQAEWNPQYGLATFAVVFLAQRKLVGLIPAALVMGQLSYAADIMPRAADVAPAFFSFIEGLLLVSLALSTWSRSRWRATETRAVAA